MYWNKATALYKKVKNNEFCPDRQIFLWGFSIFHFEYISADMTEYLMNVPENRKDVWIEKWKERKQTQTFTSIPLDF